MDSSKNSTDKTPDAPFTGWGTLGGAGLGVLIGLFTRHWIACTVAGAAFGCTIGALIDRSRRR